MSLTLAEARRCVEAARQRAEALNIRVAIAVVDDRGHLVSLDRMDGTKLQREVFAQARAYASAFFGRPTVNG